MLFIVSTALADGLWNLHLGLSVISQILAIFKLFLSAELFPLCSQFLMNLAQQNLMAILPTAKLS